MQLTPNEKTIFQLNFHARVVLQWGNNNNTKYPNFNLRFLLVNRTFRDLAYDKYLHMLLKRKPSEKWKLKHYFNINNLNI